MLNPAFQKVPSILEDFPSPSLVLHKQTIGGNLSEMIRIAGNPNRLCPHCKTHKMSSVTRWQLELGISKHKCATIAEAEMLATAGAKDIFLAYNIVGPNVQRIIKLAQKFEDVKFAITADDRTAIQALVDQIESVDFVGRPLEILIDIETGMKRTGIAIGDASRELCQFVDSTGKKFGFVTFGGFHTYDGHHRDQEYEARNQNVVELWSRVSKFRDQLESENLKVSRIVAAGTGSFPCWANIEDPAIELSPGTPTLYDAGYSDNFPDLSFVPAAALMTRVISKPAPNRVSFDLGHKACAADPPLEHRLVFPEIKDAKLVLQNEEHLVVETSVAHEFKIGQAIFAVPWHICPTTALHQEAFVIGENDQVETWTIDSRNRRLTI